MNKNARNIKFVSMPTRFLPTHGADAQKKAGWYGTNFFSLAATKKKMKYGN